MDRKAKNAEIFADTANLCKKIERLRDCIGESNNKQTLYLEKVVLNNKVQRSAAADVIVSGKRSFEAAAPYARAGKKVCVLNFASATNPGGGVVNGSSAQEEALCRCSTLYFNLNIPYMMDKFYGPHCRLNNPLYNDDCLYTPEVTVFKEDISFPELLPEKDWYSVAVLTCAAPNLRKYLGNSMNPGAGNKPAAIDDHSLAELLHSRIEKIFAVAANEGAEVLILGAFGCGAFCNPPQIVANVFKQVQQNYLHVFDTIEYAVFHTEWEKENYRVFKNVLG
ncbi:TIGR02452 family protein [Frisingicoccus sp.]|uniref:TIGR02452 family protein n=1 Tax=Frisingicoccus sp. TaxID=1918627 RepID=UPI003AB7D3C0